MIEFRNTQDTFELIVWMNDSCGIVCKLRPQDVSKLKANLNVASESMKTFVKLSSQEDLAVENMELKRKLEDIELKHKLLLDELAKTKDQLFSTTLKVKTLKKELEKPQKTHKSFWKRVFKG